MIFNGSAAFNAYAEGLHRLGPLIIVAEIGLLLLAVVHVTTGAILFYENLQARPVRYITKKRAGGRTLGSATMPYTGLLLLAFIVFHLLNFHFVDKADRTIFTIVSAAFQSPLYVFLYVAAMVVAAVHISHGFWSAFQTIGISHPKYTPAFRGIGLLLSLIVAIGFGSLPLYLLLQ